MNTKQVIVIRKDLKMRRGKECAQASHASMSFLTKNLKLTKRIRAMNSSDDFMEILGEVAYQTLEYDWSIHFETEVQNWLSNSFRKIVAYVNSEQELLELHEKALNKGLVSHLIEDNGATEFNGVRTNTCIAIGPHICSKFNDLTDHLPLL